MAITQEQNSKQRQYQYKEPTLWHVVMHNDDVTTMDFVVMVLERVFRKTKADAERIMLKIHNEGEAVAGTYYKDIAVSKSKYVMALAKQNGFPLKLSIEEA
ncbi:MAG: ATP-dependent Clp protease adaptor ClpS [Prevotella sp.]